MVKKLVFQKRPASFFKRTIAYIIDILIIDLIVILPFNKTILSITNDGKGFMALYNFILNNPEKVTKLMLISIIIVLLSLAYWSILEFKTRQSIGKMFMNIKVMSKNKGFSIWQCIVRNISKPITLLFMFDIIYLLIKKQNQRYFEKISSTIVVEEVIKI